MLYINFNAKRKGFSIVECGILMIVLVVALGAVLQTMSWAQQNYAYNRQNRDSREVLFNWVQTFESLWPPADMPIDGPGAQEAWAAAANQLIKEIGGVMGTWNDTDKTAEIDGFIVAAAPGEAGSGTMELRLLIGSGSNTWVDLERSYNIYTTDTVSDDSLQKGA